MALLSKDLDSVTAVGKDFENVEGVGRLIRKPPRVQQGLRQTFATEVCILPPVSSTDLGGKD
ncbi:14396_t:CDS:2 [Ambispora leptoticha]|uniref:14396_t:CDS:1 n=1 Tax=Ambispora leptoticha TaxID=144679 RepID=A0A9N8ZN14_9GLOM|nr:14396_t:CDS:2 [Ambispora leptoticha]